MNDTALAKNAGFYLHELCTEIDNRCVGSKGNRKATDFFAETAANFGFTIDTPEFDCIDWKHGAVQLAIGGEHYSVMPSPYTLSCDLTAPLAVASSLEELEIQDVNDNVLLLKGEIAREQLMPKNFTFYNPEHHQQIIAVLEEKAPSAIISATSRDPELAGGIYPFPLFEDGDFNIPSVYTTEEEGQHIAEMVGKPTKLIFEAVRRPSTGCNVVARKGNDPDAKIVIFAHIDAKINTPGALDNATGVIVLLLLAELLQDEIFEKTIEIVALNGEDYYSAPGEMLYIQNAKEGMSDIFLGINMDGAGYVDGKTAYSLYECPDYIARAVHKAFPHDHGFVEGEQWYQSDHSLFIMNQRPALAITSEKFMHLSTYITHTAKDAPALVDTSKLVDIAQGLRSLLIDLDQTGI
jgi:aminopeptidase YwaD